MNIIDQLKANEKPFGLMSEEMQEKARGLDKAEWEWYIARGNGTWIPINMTIRTFCYDNTYRLRSTYAEEPEIVEHEIITGACGALVYTKNCVPNDIELAYHDPDFIGFKFGGGVISTSPMCFYDSVEGVQIDRIYESDLLTKYKILHATHVLSRGPK